MSISPDPGGLVRSPKNYPTNDVDTPRIFLFRRDPINVQDFKNFKIRDMWINNTNDGVWMLTGKTRTSGTWTQLHAGAPGNIQSISDTIGTVVLPSAGGDIQLNALSGLTIVSDPGNNKLDFTVTSSGLIWSVDTTTPIAVSVGEGHISNSGGTIVYNMPAICAVGDGFSFVNLTGQFQISPAGGQTIRMGNQVTGSVTNTLTSTAIGDTVELLCVVANTQYFVLDSIGNLTVD